MPTDDLPFDVGERALLVQDRVGDGELADILQLGGTHHDVELSEVKAHPAPDGHRVGRDAGHPDGGDPGPPFGDGLKQHVPNLSLG